MWRAFKNQIHDAAISAATIAFPEKREQIAALSTDAHELVRLFTLEENPNGAFDKYFHFVSLLPQRMQVPASALLPNMSIDTHTIVQQNPHDNLLRVSLSTTILTSAFTSICLSDQTLQPLFIPKSVENRLATLLPRLAAFEKAFHTTRYDVVTLSELPALSNTIVGTNEATAYFLQRDVQTHAYSYLLCALDSAIDATYANQASDHDTYDLISALENIVDRHSLTASTDGGTTIQLHMLLKLRALLENSHSARD